MLLCYLVQLFQSIDVFSFLFFVVVDAQVNGKKNFLKEMLRNLFKKVTSREVHHTGSKINECDSFKSN